MCWYSTDEGVSNTTVTCSDNTTTIYQTTGNHTYIFWVNDTLTNLNSERVSFEINSKIFQNSINYTTSVYESETQSYWIDVTANSSLTSATMLFNGTAHTATQSGSIWNTTFVMPTGTFGNTSIIWELTYAGTKYNSTTSYQSVNPIYFELCDVYVDASDHTENTTEGFNISYLTIHFKNESDSADMNAFVDGMTVNYQLGDSTDKVTTYSNTTANLNYTFCFTPGTRPMINDLSVQYSATGFPQRRWTSSTTLTNSSTDKILYLLASADGLYSIYQVIDTAGNVLQGVEVTVEKQFSGTWTTIEQGTTDSSGSVTFWLDPDFDHRLTFVASPYPTEQVTIRPSSSTYTVTMGSTVGTENATYISNLEGLTWSYLPKSIILQPNTAYNFSFSITDSTNNLTAYKMELLDNESNVFSTTTGTTINGSTITAEINTLLNTSIIGQYSVQRNGTGWVYIESDAWWPVFTEDIPPRGTLNAFIHNFGGISILSDESKRANYSMFLLWFFLMFTLLGFLSYTTNWDQQTSGGGMLLVVPLVFLMSLMGAFTIGTGFVGKYSVALIVTLFGVGYGLTQWAKERGQ